MLRLVVIAGLVLLGYWYYTGPMQDRQASPAQQAQEYARQMNACMRQEARIAAGAGMAGMMPESGDVESVCADRLKLERREGQWMARDD